MEKAQNDLKGRRAAKERVNAHPDCELAMLGWLPLVAALDAREARSRT